MSCNIVLKSYTNAAIRGIFPCVTNNAVEAVSWLSYFVEYSRMTFHPMSSTITAVFKATFGLLVNKARDKAAENLKEGDVTDKRIRDLIQREIDDIKSKLDG